MICGRCRRWNLSPLEERWEAIDECERAFHDTPQRFSTENIGLAQLPDGTELVRIGRPRRREFAAWRYGREFWRRRVRSAIGTGAKVIMSAAGALVGADVFWVFILGKKRRVVARVHDESGRRVCVTRDDLARVELGRGGGPYDWQLVVPHHPVERFGVLGSRGGGRRVLITLEGESALHAAVRLLPKVNNWGGSDAQVQGAVALLEESPAPEVLFGRAAGIARFGAALDPGSVFLKRMAAEVRLALEMSVHEESERRALEGELAILEEAWREAEEVASIADRLLIPDAVERLIGKLRGEIDLERRRGS